MCVGKVLYTVSNCIKISIYEYGCKYKGYAQIMADIVKRVDAPQQPITTNPYTIQPQFFEHLKAIDQELRILQNPEIKRCTFDYKADERNFHRNGQTKLFYADLWALLKYIERYKTMPQFVLMAGAGGGYKGGLHLADLIPKLNRLAAKFGVKTEWHLYDPLGFASELNKILQEERITLHNEFFHKATAFKWYKKTRGHNVLFLSDIRSTKIGRTHTACTNDTDARKSRLFGLQESIVASNMEEQAEIVETLNPDMADLKCRAPYPVYTAKQWKERYNCSKFMFWDLPGKAYFAQPDSKKKSAEMRHVWYREDGFDKHKLDAKKIEQKFAWLNQYLRDGGQWDKEIENQMDKLYEELESGVIFKNPTKIKKRS
jgi:hypothetical protein